MPVRKFTVHVEGHLVQSGVWRINAVLRFHGAAPEPGDRLLGEGRLALLEGIAREGLRGRALGATQVRVCMDVAGQISEIDLTGGTPDLLH